MGGKGRKARGDRLAIANVGEYFGEDRQRRMRADRRDNPTLCKQRQQADRLDQNGLAAGVGAGNEDGELVGMKFEVERHRVLEERMPTTSNPQMAANLRHEAIS